MLEIPRPEHPRPSLTRESWTSLNGTWSFSFDFGKSGYEKGFHLSSGFIDRITVPFCPESILSGIGHCDFLDSIWYQRQVMIEPSWRGRSIMLHFGAVDYEAIIYIDGKLVGVHYGGSSSFSFDVTNFLGDGEHHSLVVHAKDDTRSTFQGGGKQSLDFNSLGCFYTRVTGIWQSVWLEALNLGSVLNYQTYSDIDNRLLHIKTTFLGPYSTSVRVILSQHGKEVVEHVQKTSQTSFIELKLPENIQLWSPDQPNLYDLHFEVTGLDGEVIDIVEGYTGIRKIHIEGSNFYLNNEPLFLRFVLDQGYYREGIWTARSDSDLRNDILISKAAGFNGARLHQKVFEERFHFWADNLGYLTWAEYPSWGMSMKSDLAARNFLSEWREIVLRDINHPSIIAWTPLNETWDLSEPAKHHRLHREVYNLTKDIDSSRPVNGASGGCQVVTDIYAVHIYEQDPVELKKLLTPSDEGNVYATLGDKEVAYTGQPYVVDEFGGIKWIPQDDIPFALDSWGYGVAPLSTIDFLQRLEAQVTALLELSHIAGYCYTQLTDVEQEQNGLYRYDRSKKFDIEEIRKIFSKTRQAP